MALLYADRVTDSMQRAMDETNRRRERQLAVNAAQGVTPRGVSKRIRDLIDGVYDAEGASRELQAAEAQAQYESMSERQVAREIKRLEKQMLEFARNLEFEKAAATRDKLAELKRNLFGGEGRGSLAEDRAAPPTARRAGGRG
jgi:excinuclease ABC subunit B